MMSPDVYISDDGGYTWARMLEGPHHYAILDSGGLIVAIEHTSQPVNVIEYAQAPLAAKEGLAGFGGGVWGSPSKGRTRGVLREVPPRPPGC